MKLRILAAVCALLGLCQSVHASPIVALGANLVFESSTDGRRLETRHPFSIRGGYRFSWADAYLEYANFRESTGSQMTFISRQHHEIVLWGRKFLNSSWQTSPYAALGAGLEFDEVTTNFGSQHADDQSSPQAMAAAALGVRVVVWENLDLQFEGRLSVAPDYSPNPMPALGIVAGLTF